MPEGLQTSDGRKVEITEADFAKAMAAPEPDEPVAAAPPRRDPEAPFGRTKDGEPKKGPGGRPASTAKHDKPRVAAAPHPEAKPASPPKDYTQTLAQTAQAAWMSLSTLSVTKSYAYLLNATAPAMVPAWNMAAQQSPAVRKVIDKLDSGGGGLWVLPVMMSTMPFVMGAIELFRNPVLRAELAAENDTAFKRWMTENAAALGMEVPEQGADAGSAHTA